jgi:hypothetical protein
MQEPAETALGHGLIFLLKHAPSRLRERPWHGTFAPRIIDDRCSGHGPRSRGVVPLHPPQRPSCAVTHTRQASSIMAYLLGVSLESQATNPIETVSEFLLASRCVLANYHHSSLRRIRGVR